MALCGKFSIDHYSVEVFVHFGDNMNESLAGTVAAIIGLMGSLMLVILVRYMKRKSVIVISTLLMMLSLIMLGVCSYGHTHKVELLRKHLLSR